MSKYEKMSDFEINKLTAICSGLDYLVSACGRFLSVESKIFDPCNNPNDAWPIIGGCGISTISLEGTMAWFACSDVKFETVCMSPDGSDNGVSCMDAKNESYHTNPLRAAMIVFLMMKDGEQCN